MRFCHAAAICTHVLLASTLATAQVDRPGEKGLPIITNYSPRDYQGAFQNWSIAQDRRGVMYFGNLYGVLEFDGRTWRMIVLPNRGTVRSLALGGDGRIYVGGVRDLGVLEASADGETVFRSLVSEIPEEYRDFEDVWEINVSENSVFFTTARYVFRWTQGEVTTWPAENTFHVSAMANGSLYVRQWGVGLMRLEGEELEVVPGGERFADERIYVILPFDDFRVLVVTRTMGIFLYDGQRFTRFETEADEFLAANPVYQPGAILESGHFAIPTVLGGVAIIDRQGALVDVIDKEAGLRDQAVLFTLVDAAGDLWLALNDGIARVEFGSPLRVFDERAGVQSVFVTVERFEGDLFGASITGLYRLDPLSGIWEAVPGLNALTFDLAVTNGRLLIAASIAGIWEYREGQLRPVRTAIDNSYSTTLVQASNRNPRRVWVGLNSGMGSLLLDENGTWIDEGQLPGFGRDVGNVVEEADGNLWLGAQDHGVYRVTFEDPDNPEWTKSTVEYYGADKGLDDFSASAFEIDGQVFAGTEQGVSRYDRHTDRFVLDERFASLKSRVTQFALSEDERGLIWLTFGENIGMLTRDGEGSFTISTIELSRLSDDQPLFIMTEGEVAWLGTIDGIVRYDAGYEGKQNGLFPTLIRSVTAGDDSLLFGGRSIEPAAVPKLAFGDNSLTFELAVPSYQEVNRNQFQTHLVGLDQHWTGWTSIPERAFTNLSPGTYEFQARARDAHGLVSEVTSYSFEILPPWYRTWWAYAIFAALFAVCVFGVDRLQRRRLLSKAEAKMRLQETQLRAEAAEAHVKKTEAEAKALQAENERHKNIELLTEMGQAITAVLSVEVIIDTVYKNVNAMMDASVFTIGIHDEASNRLVFPATHEKGERLNTYYHDLDDEARLGAVCFNRRQEIVISDWKTQYSDYVENWSPPLEGEDPSSIIYLPLVSKDHVVGVISAQSFEKDAYTEYHLNILRSLATYAAIALDNAEAYSRLNETVEELNKTLADLKTTQEQLVTQEKMASLGQLTAGIAHEIKNPLNFVNNFAELNAELARDLGTELAANRDRKIAEVYEELSDMLASLKINAQQISKHGRRADSIVKNMMQHANEGDSERFRVEVNPLVDEYIGLAYHGMRAQMPDLAVNIERDFDDHAGNAEMAPQDIGRVLINLLNNAMYAVHQRAQVGGGPDFEPTVAVSTKRANGRLQISVRDNGSGIPVEIRDRIFNPLFTTKPAGSGTGLGLSLSFDIVTSGHAGSLTFESELDRGTTFVVSLPV